jgi:hypothetical protein
MIDGGRVKLRKTTRRQKGQGKSKKQKRRFKTEWREVKQIIVFEMDEQGRMKKGTEPVVDGTFQGPDEIMEVLAMRLHQVGASQATVVAFRSDGAQWIWDRLDWVKKRLGLSDKQVSKGLDWCHAVHHVSLALEAVLEDVRAQGVDEIFCLGDVVGYGPNPRECVDLVMDCKLVLLGNHDQGAMFDPEGFNASAERATFTYDQIKEERYADDRGQDTHLDVGRGRNDPHGDIGGQQQRRGCGPVS